MKTFLILGGVAAMAAIALPQNAAAQGSTSREVVQPLPSPEIQRLNRALLELARRPGRVDALLEAGDASLAVNDYDAAIGFYGRAAEIEPGDARVKLGLARVYLRSGRPVESIPLFNAARSAGASALEVLSDTALAFDLVGDQTSAQAAYVRAIELNPGDDETRRRLAISYAISGNESGFQSALAPLITARDVAAIRARAFGLAIMGEQERAEGIVTAAMPPDLATRITPYLAYMPRLTSAQQAAAANLGIFPRAADIGREDPRIARFAREGVAGSRLEPAGAPLGAPTATLPAAPPAVAETRRIETVTREVVQAAPEPAAPSPAIVFTRTEAETAPGPVARPGFDLARNGEFADSDPTNSSGAATSRALPEIMTAQSAPTVQPISRPVSRPQPRPEPQPTASVADAFADLGSGILPAGRATGRSVNIANIEIPREARPEPKPAPAPEPAPIVHPSRIWVQLATGRDVDALQFDWRRFTRQAPDLLRGFQPHVTPWGQANRLLAGPLNSRAEARALINELAKKGVDTFAYTSPEGTEIQRLR